MSSAPRVSVIIIFFNAEPFIGEAIQSVFDQTWADWELLLVNDGSADGSALVARYYAGRYPNRVRYLAHAGHQNRGMSASRNLGIQHAKGDYIAFLDADDVWYPRTLADQVAILATCHEAALVYGPIEWWHSWTGRPEDRECDHVENLGLPADRVIRPPRLLSLFLQDKAAVPSGLLVRRETFRCVGGFEEAFRGEYEDQVFCAKVCLNLPVFAASACWYRYRQHPASCVSIGQQTRRSAAARLAFLNWLSTYLLQQGIQDRALWQSLQSELWPYHHPTLHRLSRYARFRVQQVSELLRLSRA